VHDPFLNSDWDTFFIAVPFLGALLFAFFRLDARLSAPRRQRPPASGMGFDQKGRLFLTDPDGRPWYPAPDPEPGSRD
jgi:hypothetical protein